MDGGIYTKEELLWKRFSNLYGYTFTRQYGSEPSSEWSMVLDRISAGQIGKGINACFDKHKTFPPNPMEFLTLCLPSGVDFGLPSDDTAFSQATGVSTSKHPAVAYTLRNMGDSVFEMRRASAEAARAMFNPEWVKTVVYISEGGGLPDRAVEIEEKTERMGNSEAMARLAAIKAESCPEPTEPKPTDEINTTAAIAGLEAMPVIRRSGDV